jgi:hypothetical protein
MRKSQSKNFDQPNEMTAHDFISFLTQILILLDFCFKIIKIIFNSKMYEFFSFLLFKVCIVSNQAYTIPV